MKPMWKSEKERIAVVQKMCQETEGRPKCRDNNSSEGMKGGGGDDVSIAS